MKGLIRTYDIDKSPLYRLRNRGKLADLLGLPLNYFRGDYHAIIRYNVFKKRTGRNNKERILQSPDISLKKIQRSMLRYLSRVAIPQWVISGKKGKSYIDNARYHQELPYICTVDIRDFYPSCKRNRIFNMFCKKFKMEPDIAGIMTDLVAFNGGIPTGAPTSQLVAYFTYSDVFERIYEIATRYDVKFSLYVDDITFSSNNPISKAMIYEIERVLKSVGLKLKKNKTKFYGKSDFKTITGVVCYTNSKLKVPNYLRKEIIDGYEEIKRYSGNSFEKRKLSILGKIHAARQIEPDIFQGIYKQVKFIDRS
jgi:RNA-directed DNA polymerase